MRSCFHGFAAHVGLSFHREPGVVQRIALLTVAKIRDSAYDFFRIGVVAPCSPSSPEAKPYRPT